MVSLKADQREHSHNKVKGCYLHTQSIPVPAKYYRLIIPHQVQLSATTENPTTYTENLQLKRTTQHILKIPSVTEKSTPHVENSTTAENSTTYIESSAIA
jgi:hypothetical protein